MSPKEPKLTELQTDVLQWVYDGCPDDLVWTAHRERIAARSLESRGLLQVEGKGSTWQATITEAGRTWMESKVLPRQRLIREAGELWSRVAQAGGTILIDKGADPGDYRSLVDKANSLPTRERGKKLIYKQVGSFRSPIMAVTATTHWHELLWDAEALLPLVPLPAVSQVTDPGVLGYMANKDWHYVSSASLKPAALVLQQIRQEARRRGWGTSMHGDPGTSNERLAEGVHIQIRPPHMAITVNVFETRGTGSERQEYYVRTDPKTPAWIRERRNTFIPTGNLEVSWGGSKGTPHSLPWLFREAEAESTFALQRQDEERRLAHMVEDHMSELRRIVGRSILVQRQLAEFEKRFEVWKQVTERREFLARLKETKEGLAGDELKAHTAWIAAAKTHVDSLEAEVLGAPPALDATTEDVYAHIGLRG